MRFQLRLTLHKMRRDMSVKLAAEPKPDAQAEKPEDTVETQTHAAARILGSLRDQSRGRTARSMSMTTSARFFLSQYQKTDAEADKLDSEIDLVSAVGRSRVLRASLPIH